MLFFLDMELHSLGTQMVSKGGLKCFGRTAGNVHLYELTLDSVVYDFSQTDIILAVCDVEGNFTVVKVFTQLFRSPCL